MNLLAELGALHAHLDNLPGDWDTRLVLADLYEEMGNYGQSNLQKWMVQNGRHPFFWTQARELGMANYKINCWFWYSGWTGYPDVPALLCGFRRFNRAWGPWTTRKGAEEILYNRLVS